ncbi:MAG: ABC transporter permease, partial [Chloroflexota bacterium]|nr:ABC transporter permease [Chloroflexota bacterium]
MKDHSYFISLFSNFSRIALRNLRRQFGFTTINLLGLALGIASSVIILIYVLFQLSFDDFHENSDRIYRVKYDLYRDGNLATSASTTFAAVGPTATEEFSQVEEFVRTIQRFGGGVVRYENNFFNEKRIIHADPNFFTFFSYPIVKGNPETMLDEPNTAVISTTAAERYFGDEEPMGQRIIFNRNEEYTITGVVEVPDNTHLGFDFVFSYPTLLQVWSDEVYSSWTWWDFRTYLRLSADATPDEVEVQFPSLIQRHREINSNERIDLELQPLADIHLYSDLLFENQANGDAVTVYALSAIGIFILLLAWINYINLSTARATKRAKEIGVRKVIGAGRSQLIAQFIFETFLLNLIAACIAIIIVVFGLQLFNQFAGISLSLKTIIDWKILLGFSSLFLLGTLLAALYPAVVLSGFRPALAIKENVTSGGLGEMLRKGLVVIQFSASICLIISTLQIFRQITFMQEQDLGIDLEQTIVIDLPGNISNENLNESFKQAINRQTNLQNAAISSEVPGSGEQWINPARWIRSEEEDRIALYIIAVDDDYLNNYGPKLLAGRYFSEDF